MARKNIFHQLVALMKKLRSPRGCPWDRKQTHTSLRPFLLEEAHEVLEAIDSRQPERLKDELGDLLFQIIFHAQLAAEAKRFTIQDVIHSTITKMIRRHPHVFGSLRLRTAGQVLQNWEEIKKQERQGSGQALLAGVPRSLPALLRAHRVQAKAARVGFEWMKMEEALAKAGEEFQELEQALLSRKTARVVEELGDVFLALVNLARYAGANPEDALHQAIAKFIRRFGRLEVLAQRQQQSLRDFSQTELLQLWAKTKTRRSISPKVVRWQRGKFPRPRKKPAGQ